MRLELERVDDVRDLVTAVRVIFSFVADNMIDVEYLCNETEKIVKEARDGAGEA